MEKLKNISKKWPTNIIGNSEYNLNPKSYKFKRTVNEDDD